MKFFSINGFIFFVISLILLSCQRPDGGSTKLTLSFSGSSGSSQKIGTLSTFPTGKKLCFGVNILGSGLPNNSNSCGPTLGQAKGFVSDGQIIEMDVPKGIGRTIEAYLYVLPSGSNCPTTNGTSGLNPSLMYKIATKENVDMSLDTTTVSLDATYPGDAHTLLADLSLPAACASTGGSSTTSTNYQFINRVVGTSAGIKLDARIGNSVQGVSATSAGVKLYVE